MKEKERGRVRERRECLSERERERAMGVKGEFVRIKHVEKGTFRATSTVIEAHKAKCGR